MFEINLEQNQTVKELEFERQHINKFMSGFESILSQYDETGLVSHSGFESYTMGLYQANGLDPNITSGRENFITTGIRKFYEMVKGWLVAIWNFITGKGSKEADQMPPKEDVETAKDLIKRIDDVAEGKSEVSSSVIKEAAQAPEKVQNKAEQVITKAKLPGGIKSKNDSNKVTEAKVEKAITQAVQNEIKKKPETKPEEVVKKVEQNKLSSEDQDKVKEFKDKLMKDNAKGKVEKIRTKLIKECNGIITFIDENNKHQAIELDKSNYTSIVRDLDKTQPRAIQDLVGIYTGSVDFYQVDLPETIKNVRSKIEVMNEGLSKSKDEDPSKSNNARQQISIYMEYVKRLVSLEQYMKRTIKTINEYMSDVLAKVKKYQFELLMADKNTTLSI